MFYTGKNVELNSGMRSSDVTGAFIWNVPDIGMFKMFLGVEL